MAVAGAEGSTCWLLPETDPLFQFGNGPGKIAGSPRKADAFADQYGSILDENHDLKWVSFKALSTLAVSGDALIFDPEERGPDDELKLQFEAVRQLPPEDRQAIKAILDGMIVKHRTKQIVGELRS
jgi:hypothetical protein